MQEEKRQVINVFCGCGKGNGNTESGGFPTIGENGNWFLGEEDTGVKAQGEDGITPHIGENGNWFLGDTDTGVKAQGQDGIAGPKGDKGDQGPVGPQGPKGDTGSSFNLEVLFDGMADIKDQTYQLAKSISNYNCLLAEAYWSRGATSGRISTTIPNPVYGSNEIRYRIFGGYELANSVLHQLAVHWHFSTDKSFVIDIMDRGKTSNPFTLYVSKIYGMK